MDWRGVVTRNDILLSEASVSFLFMQEMLHKPQAKIIIFGEILFCAKRWRAERWIFLINCRNLAAQIYFSIARSSPYAQRKWIGTKSAIMACFSICWILFKWFLLRYLPHIRRTMNTVLHAAPIDSRRQHRCSTVCSALVYSHGCLMLRPSCVPFSIRPTSHLLVLMKLSQLSCYCRRNRIHIHLQTEREQIIFTIKRMCHKQRSFQLHIFVVFWQKQFFTSKLNTGFASALLQVPHIPFLSSCVRRN